MTVANLGKSEQIQPEGAQHQQEPATSDTLRRRVLARETVFGVFMLSPSPVLAEAIARAGVDWVLIDLEHGTAGESDLLPIFMAIENAGSTPLVRVESGSRIRVGRALDLGAGGVMVPQVPSIEGARDAARWMRTQPAGERGIALATRGMDYGERGHDGVAETHERLLSIIQIESPGAVAQVAEMACVEGIDVLFVGPTDLTHALGIGGQFDHPDFASAVARVGAAAAAAGKAAGVYVSKPQDVAAYADKGFTFFAISSEVNILHDAVGESLQAARDAVTEAITPEVV